MANRNSTSVGVDYLHREGYLPKPFDRVRLAVSVHWYVRLEYLGPFEDLMEAGTIDPHMKTVITRWHDGSKRPQGKAQTDENGDSFHSYQKPTKLQPTRNRLIRGIHCTQRALALPGVRTLFPDGIELQPLCSGKRLEQPESASPAEPEDLGWRQLSLPDRIACFAEQADPRAAMHVLRGGLKCAIEESGMKLSMDDEQRVNSLFAAFENDFRTVLHRSKLVPVERPSLSLVVDNTRASLT